MIKALLNGIKLSNGIFIGFIQEGDIIYPGHIKSLVRALEQKEEKVAYSEIYILNH